MVAAKGAAMGNLPLIFIILTLTIDAIGIGLMIPVLPALIGELTGQGNAGAALWGGVLTTAYAAMQFLFGPALGSLSDRFGRRPVLLLSLASMVMVYLVMALTHSIWWLLASRLAAGVTAATQSTAMAYIADISPPGKKAANFGLFGAAFGIGFILGPMLGGMLGELGLRAPFLAAAGLAALNLLLGAVVLPESVPRHRRRAFSWRRANPLGAFRAVAAWPGVGLLMLFVFLTYLAENVYPAIWPYFVRERFGWGPGMIGMTLGVFGVSMALTQGVLVRPLIGWLGEGRVLLLGIGLRMLAFALLAVVGQGWVVLMLTPLAALGGLTDPAMLAIVSDRVADDSQGELQGVIASIGAVAAILAPPVMTGVFAAFSGPGAPVYLPGAPFLLALGLVALSLPVYRRAVAG